MSLDSITAIFVGLVLLLLVLALLLFIADMSYHHFCLRYGHHVSLTECFGNLGK